MLGRARGTWAHKAVLSSQSQHPFGFLVAKQALHVKKNWPATCATPRIWELCNKIFLFSVLDIKHAGCVSLYKARAKATCSLLLEQCCDSCTISPDWAALFAYSCRVAWIRDWFLLWGLVRCSVGRSVGCLVVCSVSLRPIWCSLGCSRGWLVRSLRSC